MAHLYTYNTFAGLSAGIPMTIGASLPSDPSRIAPPHLMVDFTGFIGVNTHWQNPVLSSGRLLRSSLKRMDLSGKKPFWLFDRPQADDDYHVIIFVDTSVPKGMKLRQDADVDAWQGVRGKGFDSIMADHRTGAALLRCEPDATIELFQFDGSVHQLLVVGGKISTRPLSQREMAHLRVEQFEEQIEALDLSLEHNIRRLHGILGGALRLVQAVKDDAARNVLVDFLVEHKSGLTDNLRTQVRLKLLDAGHPAASIFLDGFEAVNVVRIGAPNQIVQRRRLRSEADRATRAAMRGPSGGQRQAGTKR